jgi:non-heme chloroperoxidase
MKSLTSSILLFAAFASGQDIAGSWQGTLGAAPNQIRLVAKFAKSETGEWKGALYSIDQGDRGSAIALDSLTLQGSDLRLAAAQIRGRYEGKLSADGTTITGTWTQGRPAPLELKRATPETAWKDPSPHTVRMVSVDKDRDRDLKLEVLDWGGSGRPMVFIPGLGNTAHVFDEFATKFTPQYHVYGITRRGFGDSSAPATGYQADRLGDDVLTVLDALKIEKPVLVGHSLEGEELSSVGSRHPEKVSGLIYLDAGYEYAFYDKARGALRIDIADLRHKLDQIEPGGAAADPLAVLRELIETTLPAVDRDLREQQKTLAAVPPATLAAQYAQPVPAVTREIMSGMQKYTSITAPILAIYAVPHDRGPQPPGADAAAQDARDEETTGAQAKAFETGLASAKVVRIPHANHYVFRSNEADVIREMSAFLATLK